MPRAEKQCVCSNVIGCDLIESVVTAIPNWTTRERAGRGADLPACARRPSPLIKFRPILNLWFHVDPGSRERRPTGSNLAISVTIKALTLRDKWETSEGNVSFRSVVDTCWSWRMVDEVLR